VKREEKNKVKGKQSRGRDDSLVDIPNNNQQISRMKQIIIEARRGGAAFRPGYPEVTPVVFHVEPRRALIRICNMQFEISSKPNGKPFCLSHMRDLGK
jgi:hypothetical protein